jgi:hypothetical protein
MRSIYRSEVRAFVLASETLLSHVLLVPPMSEEERKIVQYYADSLIERCKEVQILSSEATTKSVRL